MAKDNNLLYENDLDIYDKYDTGEELLNDTDFQRYISYMKTFTNILQ